MKLLLFDAMNLIRRIYAAQEKHSDAIEQTCLLSQNAMLKDMEKIGATHVACVFDGKGPTWRHDMFAAYKADRKPMPDELAQALPMLMERFKSLGIACILFDEYEADDVIATLAMKTSEKGGFVTIVSTDKGFMQIACDHIRLYHHFDKRFLGFDDVRQQLGLEPHQLVDFLSLVGDTTNHVPGISGIGPKTAGQLLDEYGDLDQILINSESIKGKVGQTLQQDYRTALRARKLVTLKTDCHLELNLQDLRYQPPS